MRSFIQVDQEDANTLATICTVESQLKATNIMQCKLGKRERGGRRRGRGVRIHTQPRDERGRIYKNKLVWPSPAQPSPRGYIRRCGMSHSPISIGAIANERDQRTGPSPSLSPISTGWCWSQSHSPHTPSHDVTPHIENQMHYSSLHLVQFIQFHCTMQ